MCVRPTAGVCVRPTAGVCVRPTAGVCVRPTAGVCVRPTAGVCVRPTAGVCVRPTAGVCVRPTAVVEPVEFQKIAVTELHALANHVHELGDLGDDGGGGAFVEGVLAVVHHGAVVVGHVQIAGPRVVVRVEIVLFA